MRTLDLSIIIVNYNSIAFAAECIQSIESTVCSMDYEIVVIDNASREDCGVLETFSPRVVLLRSQRNIGFARANNLGAEASKGKTLLFLNPDTLVLGHAVAEMLRHLQLRPNVGAVGCRLVNADRSLQTSCVQSVPSLLNQFADFEWIRSRWPKLRLWGMRALFEDSGSQFEYVDIVCGACLMIDADVFASVGGFSSEYFMYAEEVDLCCKLRNMGLTSGCALNAEVIHFGGQSTKHSGEWFAAVVMRDSLFKFFRKFRGNAYAQLYRAMLFVTAIARLALLLPLQWQAGVVRKNVGAGVFYGSTPSVTAQKWATIASWALFPETVLKRITKHSGSNCPK